MNAALIAWIVFGGVLTAGAIALLLHELPSIRRELQLLKM